MAGLLLLALCMLGCDDQAMADAGRPPVMPSDRKDLVALEDEDRDLQRAFAEAQREFPRFRNLWLKRRKSDEFSVKKRFTNGLAVEYMWIEVTKIDGDRIQGLLQNEPASLAQMKVGDKVNLKAKDVKDWIVYRDDTVTGYFTLNALKKHDPNSGRR